MRDFPIAFAQLLGISDGLTLRLVRYRIMYVLVVLSLFALAFITVRSGYGQADSCIPVCKLFVYGSVDEVFAWLLRRAYENSSAMVRVHKVRRSHEGWEKKNEEI